MKYDLDFLMVTQSPPGESYQNQVEQIMPLLSFPLSGLILRHDKFGTHLKNRKIIDEVLFEENMSYAGMCLTDNVWNGLECDANTINSEFIRNDESLDFYVNEVDSINFDWFGKHCVISRHSLQ